MKIVLTIVTMLMMHGPPPPGFDNCNFIKGGSDPVWETWACDQGLVTCWDTDGDGHVNYSDPATGQGICKVTPPTNS